MSTPSSSSLLVIEDSDADFRLLKRLMRQMDVQSPIYRCTTGDEALAMLCQTGRYHNGKVRRLPGIIMLDLNMPGTDGRSVLARLKQDEVLHQIPVIVFTNSSASTDIKFCYQNGANGYMVKPMGLEALTSMIQAFVDYWLGSNTPPFFVFNDV